MNQNKSVFDSISLYIFQAFIFLVPVFFIPSSSVSFNSAKVGFVVLGSLLLLVSVLVGKIRTGSLSFPKTCAYGSIVVLLVTYALSAFFSANVGLSIFGQGLDQGSLVSILSFVLIFLLSPIVLDTKKKITRSYVSLFASFIVVTLFEIIHVVFPGFSLAVFTSSTSNMIGSWNDLGAFFGIAVILSMIALDKLTLAKRSRIAVYVAFVVSLVFLVLINFIQVWILLGLFGLGSLVYAFVANKNNTNRTFPVRQTVVLVLSVVFIVFGGYLGNVIANFTQTSQVAVRPSWSATAGIAVESLKSHPLLGTGPDRFVSSWLMNKPSGVNETIFWNIDFNYGVGFLPTLLVTIGLIGFLGAFSFIVIFLWKGMKSVLSPAKDSVGEYLLVSSFIAATYLWVLSFIDAPSETILALTFIVSGIFIATLVVEGIVPLKTFVFSDSRVKNFISIFVMALLVIGTLVLGYSVAKRFVAEMRFGHGSIILSTSKDIDAGQAYVVSAFNLSPDPRYSRIIADIYLARIASLLNSTTTTDQKKSVAEFQDLLGTAVQAAKESIALDSTDYQNYLELAKVYGSVVVLKISGAYDGAKTAYGQALALNPNNPEIYYDLATLDAENGDMTSAESDATKALSEKSNYTNAIYLLSQIYIKQNKLSQAIEAVKALTVVSPSDPSVFFELGVLEYSQKNYTDAAAALNQALSISPNYANAQYFLGLSDYYLKDTADAIVLFQTLSKSNPDNATVSTILSDLKAGKSLPSSITQVSATAPVSQ